MAFKVIQDEEGHVDQQIKWLPANAPTKGFFVGLFQNMKVYWH